MPGDRALAAPARTGRRAEGTGVRGGGPRPGGSADPLVLANLLMPVPELAAHCTGRVAARDWLDAFLLCAGIDQIAEDHLQGGAELADKALGYLGAARPALRLAGGPLRGAFRVAGGRARRATAGPRRWHLARASLLGGLAQLASGDPPGAGTLALVAAEAERLDAGARRLPRRLRDDVVRLPSAFRSFDLDVDDVSTLAERAAGELPDRQRPVCVVGVRTSGSYLAPLAAAALGRLGLPHVRALTLRPGHRPPAARAGELRRAVAAGGTILVVDDPPTTGDCVASVARQIEGLGAPRRSLRLVLPLFGAESGVPGVLRRWPGTFLPWPEWSIHRRLAPEAVGPVLERLLGRGEVLGLERLALPDRSWERSHARVRYRAHVADRDGDLFAVEVLIEGAGLGYLGRHALAVARAMGDRSPAVFGVEDGLVYREWIGEARRVRIATSGAPDVAAAVADHAATRARALAVGHDPSGRLVGRGPVWEAAGNLLSRPYGRAWWIARAVAVDRAVRALLAAGRPAVIDGNPDLDGWFAGTDPSGPLVKVGGDVRAFSNLDLACFDPVFDLAGLAAGSSGLGPGLRRAYEARTGGPVGEERWLVYLLVALWDLGRRRRVDPAEVAARSADALRAYYEAVVFAGVACPAEGPVCAFDVDGVLETRGLGFTGLTPASAMALRALACHGYRAVVATGRGLDEVRDRCGSYRLAGGVAEYGAVAYDHGARRSLPQVPGPARDALGRVRRRLAAAGDVRLDEACRYTVRAYRLDGGVRRAADAATVEAALDGEHGLVTVRGDDQVDVVPARVCKGAGLDVLLASLAGGRGGALPPLVLGVGDGVRDLPVLARARCRALPAHARHLTQAEARVPGGPIVTARPYQAGASQAVAALLGHPPGRCRVCALPSPGRETRLLLRVLAAHEGSVPSAVWRLLALAAAGRRP